MSRYYAMSINVSEFNPEKADAIQEAITDNWTVESCDFYTAQCEIYAYGKGSLYGGTSETEFVDRLAVDIWRANGDCCTIDVEATYLEDLPYNSYCRDEDEYDELMEDELTC